MHVSQRPIITFLTDFGLDGAAATCRGVMLSICRDAQIVDISHTVRKYAIGDGAFILRAALPFMPIGVHVAVVDPGVGTSRRPIGIRAARGDVLIGPDNGLLIAAADALEGPSGARELANRALWLHATTATFHGRDIFAPVAAHLAAGDVAFEALGPEIPIADLVRLPDARARTAHGLIETEVAYVDSFGNLRLAGTRDDLVSAFRRAADGDRFTVTLAGKAVGEAVLVRSFGHVASGETLLYVDSTGDLALADNRADLAARIGAVAGMPVSIEAA
jgi:hypothetical protein